MSVSLPFPRLRAGLAITCLLCLGLPSCALFNPDQPPEPRQKPVASAKPVYTPYDYALHLTLAHLILANETPDGSATRPHFDIVEDYARQKRKKTELSQPVIILEYSRNDKKKTQRLAIPFTLPVKKPDFPALDQVVKRLAAIPHTTHSIAVASIPVIPQKTLSFNNLGKEEIKSLLMQQEDELLEHVNTVPALEEAYIQLQLARFFMIHRIRDESYLTLENAKRKLAEATAGGDHAEKRAEELAKELEVLENQLRQDMPFTISLR